MKVVTAVEMARIEKIAYSQGASEEEFMNSAGRGVAELVQHVVGRDHLKPKIVLLAGAGNNAGDGYVALRFLLKGGFEVHAITVAPIEKCSPLCQLQRKRFEEMGGIVVELSHENFIQFHDAELLIDALLGTGFHGEIVGLMRALIEKANATRLPIIAIDIPSGINGTTAQKADVAIRASDTLFLGLPKAGCFSQETWSLVGRVHVYNFGLAPESIEEAEESYNLIDHAMTERLLPQIVRTRHKYQAGYVVGIGGSKGMPGAPVMASFAALKSGAGIVRLLHPEGMEQELSFSPPELIKQSYQKEDGPSILEATKRAAAVFIGPGMGTSDAALHLLKVLLPQLNKPCVIDAEALTLLAKHEISMPAHTILTPHHGEMMRLLHIEETANFLDLLEKAQNFVDAKKLTLVLKGAPTFILHPDKKPYVCSKGDPGMATAGSGDVLTGVIAACLAQLGGEPLKAAILGVQLHALAGELAAQKLTSYAMTATDITASLPLAFKELIAKANKVL